MGNVGNKTAAMIPSTVWNLQEHFNNLKKLADVSSTRTLQEMTGQVSLCDNNDQKIYLPSCMSKTGCCHMYCLNQGYNVKGNNDGNVVHTWISSPEEEPQVKTVASWNGLHDYWDKHHTGKVVIQPSRDICSLCHIFSN